MITAIFSALMGIALLFFGASMLSDLYNDVAEYCESKCEETTQEYSLEVDVDPETGQRTSTIKPLP